MVKLSDLRNINTQYEIFDIKRPSRRRTPDFGLFGRARFTNATFFVEKFAVDSKIMQVFLAIYNIELLNSLADEGIVNGEQLAEELNPGGNQLSIQYTLDDCELELDMLQTAGLLVQVIINTPTRGYGNDQGFILTRKATQLLEGKSEKQIAKKVFHFLCEPDIIDVDED